MQRIGIDCRLAGLSHAGIGRYIGSFVPKAIELLAGRVEVVLFCSTRAQADELWGKETTGVQIVLAPIKHYSFAEQTKFLFLLYKYKLDVLHVPHFNVPLFYTGKFVVTIHDLLWHKQRGTKVTTLNPFVYWLKYFFYQQIVRHAVTSSSQIFVPSQTIADELATTYPTAKSKTLITYEGVSSSLLPKDTEKVARKNNTILYVGSLYPHKNIEIVFQLLEQNPDIMLEIVTARSVFTTRVQEEIKKRDLQSQVQFFLGISDTALARKYQETTAVVQPSLSEGFGLTGLEALLHNTPLLASNIPIFKEIYQTHATYFEPRNVNSLEKAWQTVQKNGTTTALPEAFIARYNWDKLAKITTDAYRTALDA